MDSRWTCALPDKGQEVPVTNNRNDGEKVLGGLEVEAFLRLGSEHLFLLFTQSRIILAHQAKIGRSAVLLYGLLGKMSEGLKRSLGKGALKKFADMDPSGIVSLNPENFSIEYPRVVTLRVEPAGDGRSKITLVTIDQKIELYASLVASDGVREQVKSLLDTRVEYRG